MTKSKMIENLIENMVENGVIHAGEAVPSIREMAAMYEMSVTPVIVAYHNLEERGILQAKSKSKFIVIGKKAEPKAPARQGTDYFNSFYDIHHILTDDKVSFPFGIQEPFTTVASNEVMLKKFARSMRNYMSPEELQALDTESQDLQSAICRWMYKCNCMVSAEDITIINGSMVSTISLALQCCTKPGDLVGMATPGDISHHLALQSRGLIPVSIHMSPGMGLDIEILEQTILNNPEMRVLLYNSNYDLPTGTLLSKENRHRLAELCQKHNITVIEDDRNSVFGHKGFRPPPIASLIPDNTIYIGCVNFNGAANMRIHWVSSHQYRSELKYYSMMMGLVPPIFIQRAYADLVNSSLARTRRTTVCASYLEATTLVRKAVYRYFPSGTIAYQPSGGYLLWVKLPENCDGIELCHKAYAHGITIMPGIMFSNKNDLSNYICLNCSVATVNPNWETGIRLLGSLTETTS